MYQLEEYEADLRDGRDVPDYPEMPTYKEDPTVKVEPTHGQENPMTQTLNSQFPTTSPITLRTF